jgi:hypothetical protein
MKAEGKVKKEAMQHLFNDVESIEERVNAMTCIELTRGKAVTSKARVLTKEKLTLYKLMHQAIIESFSAINFAPNNN